MKKDMQVELLEKCTGCLRDLYEALDIDDLESWIYDLEDKIDTISD